MNRKVWYSKMKKFLSLLLALVMVLALFAACDNNNDIQETESSTEESVDPAKVLKSAKDYVKTLYRETNGTKALRDFEVIGVVRVGEKSFTITWTVDKTDYVKVVPSEDGTTVTIDIEEKPSEQVDFVLTATVTDEEGNTDSISFNRFIEGVVEVTGGPVLVEAPVAGNAYKLALRQENLGKFLYFAGEMSGNYFATTELAIEAADVYMEEVEGGVRFYFMNGEEKTYLDIHEYQEGKAGVRLTTEPSAVFTYSEDAKTYVANVAGSDRYLGTYNTYNTISASATSYITGDKAANVGVSQFVLGFYTVPVSTTVVEAPTAGVAYKFALRQENLGKDLYFSGEMSGNYFATTENAVAAVDVYLEEVEGGVRFYFMNGEEKTYLDIHEYQEGKAGVRLTTEPSAVFTYSEDAKTYVANVAGSDRYLGTYNTYNTISASATSYITGDKAANVGVSQFVAGFRTVNFAAKAVEAPEAGVAYKFTLRQENLGKDLYFSGEMSGNYFATTTNPMDAANVYMEEVEGGVRFYFMNGEEKTYLDIHEYQEGKAGVRLTTEPSATFTYSEDAKTYVANVAGSDRYLGTYNTYNTISASATSYITGDKAANVGVSQFVAYFAIVDLY